MDQDQFNDFQQPPQNNSDQPHQNNHSEHPSAKDSSNLLGNNLFDFGTTPIYPSSSLATNPLQQSSRDTGSNGLEDSYWPHLNKMMSENLSSVQPISINFEKSHSQLEHKIDIFDIPNSLLPQNKTQLPESAIGLKEEFVFQDYAKIKVEEKPKTDQYFSFNNQSDQSQAFNDFPAQKQPSPQVKLQQPNIQAKENSLIFQKPIENHTALTSIQPQGINNQANSRAQEEKLRKQSQQFVFQEAIHPKQQLAAEIRQQKQQQDFVFESQQLNNQNFLEISNFKVQQTGHKQNTEKQNQSQLQDIQGLVNNTNIQTNTSSYPQERQDQRQKVQSAHLDEDQEFGDYEETVTNTVQPSKVGKETISNHVQKLQNLVQIQEELIPYGSNATTKKKQLEQLVSFLPNFSYLFSAAFQSL